VKANIPVRGQEQSERQSGNQSRAAASFAIIGADVRIPTTNLTLAPLSPGWTLVGSVTWSAFISYTDHGRNDCTNTFTGTSDVWTPVPIDFAGVVQGGVIELSVAASVRDTTGVVVQKTWSGHNSIVGANPSRDTIRARLPNLRAQVVAYKESRFRQFDVNGMPLVSSDNGFGIMQLTMNPAPTARQLWDWTQNVDAGVGRLTANDAVVRQHYANLSSTHPTLPVLDTARMALSAYQYYNTGNKGFYWIPNASFDSWDKNPNTSYTTYADDATHVENLVAAGTPPIDW